MLRGLLIFTGYSTTSSGCYSQERRLGAIARLQSTRRLADQHWCFTHWIFEYFRDRIGSPVRREGHEPSLPCKKGRVPPLRLVFRCALPRPVSSRSRLQL